MHKMAVCSGWQAGCSLFKKQNDSKPCQHSEKSAAYNDSRWSAASLESLLLSPSTMMAKTKRILKCAAEWMCRLIFLLLLFFTFAHPPGENGNQAEMLSFFDWMWKNALGCGPCIIFWFGRGSYGVLLARVSSLNDFTHLLLLFFFCTCSVPSPTASKPPTHSKTTTKKKFAFK